MSTEEAFSPAVATVDVCSCGQDLECCRREHCPRCGCEIHRAA